MGRDGRPVHHGGEDNDPAVAAQGRRPAGHPHRPRRRLPDRRCAVSLRTRFALLYAGAFGIIGLLVVGVAFLSTKQTTHVGSTAPPVTTYPLRGQVAALA